MSVVTLIGLRIQLDRAVDVPCGSCAQTIAMIGPGTGPHAASLCCANCYRHRGWLPNSIIDFLMDTINRFGRPTDDVVIRNNSKFAPANATAPSGAPRPQHLRHPEPDMKGNC